MSRAALTLKTKLIAAAAVLAVATGGGIFLAARSDTPTEQPAATVPAATEQTEEKTDYITYEGEVGKTALELLKTNADIQTETSDFGELVTSINGEDGNGEKYWIFYVDGEMASVGAGDYDTKNGEKIEWRLE